MKKFDIFTLVCQGLILLFAIIVGCNIKGEEVVVEITTTTTTVETTILLPPITPKPLPTPE